MTADARRVPAPEPLQQRPKRLTLDEQGPPLPAIKTRRPKLYQARLAGASIFSRTLSERGIPNGDVAADMEVDEKDVRRWRSAREKLGFGEVLDMNDRLAETLLLEGLDYVRARRRGRNDNHG